MGDEPPDAEDSVDAGEAGDAVDVDDPDDAVDADGPGGPPPAESGDAAAGGTAPADAADGRVDSDWWYVAAGVVVWGAVLVPLLLVGRFLVPTDRLVRPLAYLGVALLLLLPAALYVDGGRVADAGGEWAPSRTLYAVAAVGGVVVPPLGVGVAGLYLLRRHRHVGVP